MLDAVIQYVEAVMDGTQEPDNSVGRALNSLILSVPKMDVDQFEVMLNSNLKNLLMVIYLSQMTKTQLHILLLFITRIGNDKLLCACQCNRSVDITHRPIPSKEFKSSNLNFD